MEFLNHVGVQIIITIARERKITACNSCHPGHFIVQYTGMLHPLFNILSRHFNPGAWGSLVCTLHAVYGECETMESWNGKLE